MPLADGGGGGSAVTKRNTKRHSQEVLEKDLLQGVIDAQKTMRSSGSYKELPKEKSGGLFNPEADISGGRVEHAYIMGPQDPWNFFDSGHGVDWDPRQAGRQDRNDPIVTPGSKRDITPKGYEYDMQDTDWFKEIADRYYSERSQEQQQPRVRGLLTTSNKKDKPAKQPTDQWTELGPVPLELGPRGKPREQSTDQWTEQGPMPLDFKVTSDPEKKKAVDEIAKAVQGDGPDQAFGTQSSFDQWLKGPSKNYASDVVLSERMKPSDAVLDEMRSRLVEEATGKGIKGRGVQAYVQERMSLPGMDNYGREEFDRMDRADVSEEMADSKARATRTGMKENSGKRTEQMTFADYQALTPKQKAAVDLNTLLVEAVKQDLKIDRKEGPQYDERIEAVFGDSVGDNQPFAPSTLNLLEKIKYNGEADDTNVNDFLKLRAAFTADDIDDLKPRKGEAPDAGLATAAYTRDTIQAGLVEALGKARTDTDTRGEMFETQRELLGTDKRLGFGEGQWDEEGKPVNVDGYFQSAFDLLSQTGGPKPETIMADAKNLLDDREFRAFVAFLDLKSRESKQYDIPLGQDVAKEYKPVRKFRTQLNLNG